MKKAKAPAKPAATESKTDSQPAATESKTFAGPIEVGADIIGSQARIPEVGAH